MLLLAFLGLRPTHTFTGVYVSPRLLLGGFKVCSSPPQEPVRAGTSHWDKAGTADP